MLNYLVRKTAETLKLLHFFNEARFHGFPCFDISYLDIPSWESMLARWCRCGRHFSTDPLICFELTHATCMQAHHTHTQCPAIAMQDVVLAAGHAMYCWYWWLRVAPIPRCRVPHKQTTRTSFNKTKTGRALSRLEECMAQAVWCLCRDGIIALKAAGASMPFRKACVACKGQDGRS